MSGYQMIDALLDTVEVLANGHGSCPGVPGAQGRTDSAMFRQGCLLVGFADFVVKTDKLDVGVEGCVGFL